MSRHHPCEHRQLAAEVSVHGAHRLEDDREVDVDEHRGRREPGCAPRREASIIAGQDSDGRTDLGRRVRALEWEPL